MTVVDVTHLLRDEQGTAYDEQTLLFSQFEDGAIFNYDHADYRARQEMLERDGKALTIEQALTLPIRRARPIIRRGPASVKVTKFVEEALFKMSNSGGMSTPLSTIIGQMTSAFTHKKAFFEKVWKLDENDKFVYDKVAWRPASTCQIKRDKRTGAFQGFTQNPIRMEDTDPLFFKPEHAFVYIHGQTRNPLEGISAMEVPFWCYQTKQKIRFLWYSYLEGQSLPKTVVTGKTQKEANEGARKLIALRQGGVVGITDQIKFDTLESSGKGGAQFLEALRWLDSEASGSALAGFTDLGGAAAGGTGSFALSKDQTDFFLMSREADAEEMAMTVGNFLVADLVRWNFGPNEPCPIFEFTPIAEDDAAQSITLLTSLATATTKDVPNEFMEELTEKVAGYLNMDTNRVRDGLEKKRKEAEEKAKQLGLGGEEVAGMSGAVDGALKMVQNQLNPPALPQQPNQTSVPRIPRASDNPDTLRPRPFRASRNA